MAYFKRFPVIANYEISDRTYDAMDITRRTGFAQSVKDNEALYLEHEIRDGESPIVLADRIYDDSDLYWIIMLFNDIYDINTDWPLDYSSFESYIDRKYEDRNAIHHYESITANATVDSDWPEYDKKTITNYDYEISINDKKRNIKVPVPEAASQLVREHHRLISQ